MKRAKLTKQERASFDDLARRAGGRVHLRLGFVRAVPAYSRLWASDGIMTTSRQSARAYNELRPDEKAKHDLVAARIIMQNSLERRILQRMLLRAELNSMVVRRHGYAGVADMIDCQIAVARRLATLPRDALAVWLPRPAKKEAALCR